MVIYLGCLPRFLATSPQPSPVEREPQRTLMLGFLLKLSKKPIGFTCFLAFAKREDKSLYSREGLRVRFF
jgi:hypothetical protein